LPYVETDPAPIIDVKYPFYAQLEEHLTADVYAALSNAVYLGRSRRATRTTGRGRKSKLRRSRR
jgi:hypothetical protein